LFASKAKYAGKQWPRNKFTYCMKQTSTIDQPYCYTTTIFSFLLFTFYFLKPGAFSFKIFRNMVRRRLAIQARDVQVSDTTGDATCTAAGTKKYFIPSRFFGTLKV